MLPSLLSLTFSSSSLSSCALLSLAAQVPGGFLLSPGEVLAGLAEVWVGRDGLYGDSDPVSGGLEVPLGGRGVSTTSDGPGTPASPPDAGRLDLLDPKEIKPVML